jgi:glycerophosphoryl diester phosphodiesterase
MTNFFLRGDHKLLNIAHRGGAAVRPENTLVAFRHALTLGAVALEGDLHATRDGVVVVCHDPTVDRTTDGSGPIKQMALHELRRLDAGYRFTRDGGRTHPYRGVGIQVPTLQEVFSDPALNRTPMILEIKQQEPMIADTVLDLVRAHGMEDRLVFGSFHQTCLEQVRSRAARREMNILTSLAPEEVVAFFLTPLEAHANGDYVPPGRLLQVPVEHDLEGEKIKVVTEEFMTRARAAGLGVQVWTVNDPAEMRWLALELKVAAIMTDDPGLLREVLRESGYA